MKYILNKIGIQTLVFVIISILFSCAGQSSQEEDLKHIPESYREGVKTALKNAGSNYDEILNAIKKTPAKNIKGMAFLLENMPNRDLTSLSADFLLENVNLSYQVMDSVHWGKDIPNEIFLNYILPYANLHERRDNWRRDFLNKFLPLVKDLKTPSEALLKLNSEVWDIVNVHYSTKRPKADQSPYESIDAGLASCTGLSILLIDVCRAVGIPARFVGVPLWKDHSGNHSWVEIWDNGWHCIGAAEKGQLDKTWFVKRAALADDSNWKYSIYAASYKKTSVIFPPLFDSTATYVYADIITDRYNKEIQEDGMISLAVRLFDHLDGSRVKGKVIVQQNSMTIHEGETMDEKYDYNDFLIFRLKPIQTYNLIAELDGNKTEKVITTDSSKFQFVELYLEN
ncbi:MAG: transglutaminase-like domain-containing protein [Bacteroidota bacterium]